MPTLKEPYGLKKGRRLDDLEHKAIEADEYKTRLKEQQLKLLNLTHELTDANRSLIVVFEGPDAAGKGGAIKRAVERLIVKFYLHISKDEQLLRFKRREADPYKHWKINDEDWRNRRKWDEHNSAAEDMFEKTSTENSPWNVIAANYKWYARIKVVKGLVDALERAELKRKE